MSYITLEIDVPYPQSGFLDWRFCGSMRGQYKIPYDSVDSKIRLANQARQERKQGHSYKFAINKLIGYGFHISSAREAYAVTNRDLLELKATRFAMRVMGRYKREPRNRDWAHERYNRIEWWNYSDWKRQANEVKDRRFAKLRFVAAQKTMLGRARRKVVRAARSLNRSLLQKKL